MGPVVPGPVSLMKMNACLGASEDSPGHLGSVAGPASSPTTGGSALVGPAARWPLRPSVVGTELALGLGWYLPTLPRMGTPPLTPPTRRQPPHKLSTLLGPTLQTSHKLHLLHPPPPRPHSAVALSPPTSLSGRSVLGAGGASRPLLLGSAPCNTHHGPKGTDTLPQISVPVKLTFYRLSSPWPQPSPRRGRQRDLSTHCPHSAQGLAGLFAPSTHGAKCCQPNPQRPASPPKQPLPLLQLVCSYVFPKNRSTLWDGQLYV